MNIARLATGAALYRLVAIISALVVSVLAARTLDDAPMDADAVQNVRAAYHIVHTGVWGADEAPTPTPRPQIRREPLPILVIAGYLVVDPAFDSPYTIDDVSLGGPLTTRIKNANLFWVFLGVLGIFYITPALTRTRPWAMATAIAAIALSTPLYFLVPQFVNRFYTELPATTLMIWAAVFALWALQSGRRAHLVLLGAGLGGLVLTKAAFLYIAPPFVLLLLFLQWLRNPERRRAIPRAAGFILLAMAAVCAPWAIRNAIVFGQFTVASRGGDVLALRAYLLDQPVAGMFYVYSPAEYRDPIMGPLTGYTEADLEPGARLAGLDKTVERERWQYYEQWLAAEGLTYSNGREAESLLAGLAVRKIMAEPTVWLASIPPFFYRGMWWLRYDRLFVVEPYQLQRLRIFLDHMTILTYVIFMIVGLFSVIARRPRLFAIFGLSFGWLLFHAALTHNIPRYGAPPIPLMMIALVWLAYSAGRGVQSIVRPRSARPADVSTAGPVLAESRS